MSTVRRKLDAALKVQVVLEAIRGRRITARIASEYGVDPNEITIWKRYFLDQLPHIFSKGNNNKENAYEEERGIAQKDRSAGDGNKGREKL